jgi:hypothetical protein
MNVELRADREYAQNISKAVPQSMVGFSRSMCRLDTAGSDYLCDKLGLLRNTINPNCLDRADVDTGLHSLCRDANNQHPDTGGDTQ